jgi:transposase
MMKKTRRKMDAALKAKIALGGAARAVDCYADLAQRYRCIQTGYTPGGSSFRSRRRGAFDAGIGRDAEDIREREIEKLHASIGRLIVEWHSLARRSGG